MITARVPVSAEHVGSAFGAPVIDVEPAQTPGAFSSVFHAFRAEPSRPGGLPTRVSVLPYANPAWTHAGRAWLSWEAEIWAAFWASVRAAGPEAGGRWALPPLVDEPRASIRVFDIPTPAGVIVAFARPSLPWPTVAAADLPEDRVRAAWARGVGDLGAHLPPNVALPALPADLASFPDARRRLLTNGQRIIPTHWRSFDARWQRIDHHRRRVAAN